MKYLYQQLNTDKKNLEHIEWFVGHHQDYLFEKGTEIEHHLQSLKTQIINKNIYYSDLVEHYHQIANNFTNNPYDYKYDLFGQKANVETNVLDHYFVTVKENQKEYTIPYAYALENQKQNTQAKEKFDELLCESQEAALDQFEAIENRYQFYLQSGVLQAVNRFRQFDYGKKHHFVRLLLSFAVYQLLLIALLHVTQLGNIVLETLFNGFHFVDHVQYMFSGCPIWMSLIVFGFVIYFISLDIIYIYSIYYMIYSTLKYQHVYRLYLKTEALHKVFAKDYQNARNGIEPLIEKVNHRKSCYLPLIKYTSQTFKFSRMYFYFERDKGRLKLKKGYELQYPDTPIDLFYKKKIYKQILWEFIVLVVAFSLLIF